MRTDSKLFLLGILLLVGAVICLFFAPEYAVALFAIGLVMAVVGAITGW